MKKALSIIGILIFPVILFFLFMALTGGKLGFSAIPLLLNQAMIPAMLGLSMAILMMCGLMDFSVGCRVIFACTVGYIGYQILGFPGFILGVVLGAMTISAALALCYRYLKIPSLVASMGFVLLGEISAYYITKAFKVTTGMFFDKSVVAPFAFPLNFIWVAIAAVIFYLIMYHTKIGAHIATVGDDEVLAESMGVSPKNTKTIAYLISGFFIIFAAFLQVGSIGIVSAPTGMATMSMVFQPMMGVIIGLTLLPLWNNFPVMVIVGEVCIIIIFNGLMALGLSDRWQNVFLGLFMFAVLGVSGNIGRVREWRRRKDVSNRGPSAYLTEK